MLLSYKKIDLCTNEKIYTIYHKITYKLLTRLIEVRILNDVHFFLGQTTQKYAQYKYSYIHTMMKNALKWCLLYATTITVTNAVRVAFIADTGIGNDNPSDYWYLLFFL